MKSLYRKATPGELALIERRSNERLASMNPVKVKTPKPPKGAKRKAK